MRYFHLLIILVVEPHAGAWGLEAFQAQTSSDPKGLQQLFSPIFSLLAKLRSYLLGTLARVSLGTSGLDKVARVPGSPRSPMKKRMENGLVELRTGAKNDSGRVHHDSIDGDVLHPGNKNN
ncbi:hypothetical protein B0T20DRAFT_396052 [Sordaria brevicollis]|uniref:Uncharacterized protein n=1 Tax=Sordaria brevicollis TaxID=83679 RepID=A0AAE0P3P4_SORBR|nr:hypothetical protein B0T20DRAFT_396052 [Sordaria brevicollis]